MAATDDELTKNITQFLGTLLDKNCVDAVLVPMKQPAGEGVVQSLVSHKDMLKNARPMAFVMPVNSGTIISDMTKVAPSSRTLAVVVKSCEIRALIELVKLKQASLDNIVIIGVDCPGTYSVNQFKQMVKDGQSPTVEFLKNVQEEKDDVNMREACRVCERPIPDNADITIGLYGTDFKTTLFFANTETGKEVLAKAGIKSKEESEKRKETISALEKRRLEAWNTLSDATKAQVAGIENLLAFFDSCINCHNCMDVCPVCYCRECFFESPTFEYESDKYLSWAKRKGAIKMPRDTILFHLTRLNHMSTSCVGCGMCEQACPSKIELLRFYKTVGYKAQMVFDYVAGRSIDEALPLLTFREDELDPK